VKRFLLLVGLVATVGLVAAAASPAATTNTTVPISGSLSNPCTGELIVYSGTLHFNIRTTTDSGGSTHTGIHENIQVTGVGSFGNTYLVNAEGNNQINWGFTSGGNGAAESTTAINEEFVAKGSAPNFYVLDTEHITIAPDGTVTSEHSDFDITCQ
jgi:hypothetical protein